MHYYQPGTRAEALAALGAEAEGARVMVGGTDLLVALRHHALEPSLLIDIKTVSDLPAPISVDDDGITVGPTLTMSDLIAHPRVQEWYPALVEAARTVGSVAIRNRASLIGNVCNGSPAADTAPPLLVHNASATIASPAGDRVVSLTEFFLAPRRTLCAAGQLVASLRLPRPTAGSGSAFLRMTRRRGVDLATVSVAAYVDDEQCVTLGLGAVGPKPLLSHRSAPVDLDSPGDLMAAIDELLAVSSPIADVRASREYRVAMLRVLARRAVLSASDRRTPAVMP